MKQKLLKNVRLWVGVGIVLLAVGAVCLVGSKTERIFDYVPQSANQAFVVRVNPKNTLLYQNYMQQLPGEIETLFAKMDIVVISQTTVDAVAENLIFVQAKPDFKPQALVDSMNVSGDVEYIYQQLEDNLYVFGKPDSLKFLKLDTKNNFFATEKLKSLAPLLRSSEISFFSHVANNVEVTVTTPFVGNMEYFVYGLDMEGKKISMEARLVYKENRPLDAEYSFKPLFKGYSNDKNLLFAEFGHVAQQLGVKKEVILANLQALLPMWGVTDLTEKDYETIYSALSNNVGLLLGEGNNFAGVGLTLLFRDSDFFAVLSKIMPTAYSMITAIPFLSGSQTALVNDPLKQGFSAQVAGVQDVGLYTEKKGDDTLLTLGDPAIQTDKKVKVDYSSQTLGYFRVNFTPLLNVYKRFKTTLSSLSPLGQTAGQEDFSFFEEKSLAGQVVAHADGVAIKAVLE